MLSLIQCDECPSGLTHEGPISEALDDILEFRESLLSGLDAQGFTQAGERLLCGDCAKREGIQTQIAFAAAGVGL